MAQPQDNHTPSGYHFDRIPTELTTRQQWVLWKLETKGDKATKVPYQCNGHKASATAPKTWATFERVCATFEQVPGTYQGIGYVFAPDDPFTGTDLDHCRNAETGEIAAWALSIIEQIATYAEISQSGTGLHLISRATLDALRQPGKPLYHSKLDKRTGELKHGTGGKVGGVEIYDQGRFFTVTGNHLASTPETPQECQEAVIEAFTTYLSNEPPPENYQRQAEPIMHLGDSELIAKISKSKQGAKFDRLMRGDQSDYPGDDGRPDWSRADSGLCWIVAWWTKEYSQIERIWACSALAIRPKFERIDYRDMTINHAIAYVAGSYDPHYRSGTTVYKGKRAEDSDEDGDGDPTEPSGKPGIIVNNRPTRDSATEAIRALIDANSPPVLFRRDTGLARVMHRDDGCPLIGEVNTKEIRARLTDTADFLRMSSDGDLSHTLIPNDLAQYCLVTEIAELPPIDAIIEVPTLRPDGTIISEQGYDTATKLFLEQSAQLVIPTIPDSPTQAQARNAAQFLLDDVFTDFPFAGEADKANALAMLLTPVVRAAIGEGVPMALIEAPDKGTGKGLLSEVVALVCTGRRANMTTAPLDETEWEKLLLTLVMEGAPIVTLDNLEGKLESPKLASALTAAKFKGRILGVNKSFEGPQRATWIATGNNVRLGRDMPRRCYRIRIDAKMSRPWQRDPETFKHPHLLPWVAEHRGEILSALLTIARAWYVAGKPNPTIKLPALGSFEEWKNTIGGMLAYAGIGHFLANLEEMYKLSDDDTPQWESFLGAWNDLYSKPITAGDIARYINDQQAFETTLRDTLPDELKEVKPDKLAWALGKALTARMDRRFGSEQFMAIKDGTAHRAVCWRVIKGTEVPIHEPPNPRTSPGELVSSSELLSYSTPGQSKDTYMDVSLFDDVSQSKQLALGLETNSLQLTNSPGSADVDLASNGHDGELVAAQLVQIQEYPQGLVRGNALPSEPCEQGHKALQWSKSLWLPGYIVCAGCHPPKTWKALAQQLGLGVS